MLLTADNHAKIGDVGLARFMPNDYMSAQAAIGAHGKCFVKLPTRRPHVDMKASSSGGLVLTFGGNLLSKVDNLRACLTGAFVWSAPEVLMGAAKCSNKVRIYGFGVMETARDEAASIYVTACMRSYALLID